MSDPTTERPPRYGDLSETVMAWLAALEPPVRLDPWQRQAVRRFYARPYLTARQIMETPIKRGGIRW